jgi:hypothetical protein
MSLPYKADESSEKKSFDSQVKIWSNEWTRWKKCLAAGKVVNEEFFFHKNVVAVVVDR